MSQKGNAVLDQSLPDGRAKPGTKLANFAPQNATLSKSGAITGMMPENKALFATDKVKEATNKALFATDKVKEATNKDLFAANKIKEATNKDLFATDKVKEATNKALFAANKVKEATNKAFFAPDKVKEATNKALFAPDKVKEATNKAYKIPNQRLSGLRCILAGDRWAFPTAITCHAFSVKSTRYPGGTDTHSLTVGLLPQVPRLIARRTHPCRGG
jgi:hypothetical protein